MKKTNECTSALSTLAALGFGPDSALMRDPKLLLDGRFLSSLLAEFRSELGEREANLTLFQIGLMRGLRDSNRLLDGAFSALRTDSDNPPPSSPPLALCFGSEAGPAAPGSHRLHGTWPEGYEASARLAKFGSSDSPCCALSAGYTSGWLSGAMDSNILAIEQECVVAGAEECRFVAREIGEWRRSGDARAAALLEVVRIELFREALARERSQASAVAPTEVALQGRGEFDPNAPVVHWWGPVMVVPFASPDDGLETVELLSHDPDTAGVRVVVIDLRDSQLDAAFGAVILERALEAIEEWGAEVILTGVSPLSEAAVAELERGHLVVQKDLPEAIASAFQIADAQRHQL